MLITSHTRSRVDSNPVRVTGARQRDRRLFFLVRRFSFYSRSCYTARANYSGLGTRGEAGKEREEKYAFVENPR